MTQLSFEGVLFFNIKIGSRGLCLHTHFGGGRKRQEGKRKKEMEDQHDSMNNSYLEVKFKK